ncbi:Tetratricopeptide repeat protein 25 [Entophlyctis sp. JEL0112]|nr:Tetratricopeptide repeat protein 25 [Entophlyctis sp. JEL0112]
MVHPGNANITWAKYLALSTVLVDYYGKPAHAASCPWEGANALDALISAYTSISMLRQQVLPTTRIHGIIKKGGDAPNIIPDHTQGEFMMRTEKLSDLNSLQPKMDAIFRSAAAATGTTVNISTDPRVYSVFEDVVINSKLAGRFERYAKENGCTFPSKETQVSKSYGSTDMGNVTHAVPGIHPVFDIECTKFDIHTNEFREAASTEKAHSATLRAAKCLSLTAFDFISDIDFREEVKAEFVGAHRMPSNPNGNSDDESVHLPVSSFQSLFAEGDILAKQGDFRKAVDAFSKALEMRLNDKHCLVARSKCYLQLGDSESALEDANMALKQDSAFFRAILYKAEALYSKGDFEMALVFYHRGNKMRPELNAFRLGIQKAREAIDNSIGNPKDYKFQAPAGIKITPQGQVIMSNPSGPNAIKSVQSALSAKKERPMSGKNVKQLLGELYKDREYLENFLLDKGGMPNIYLSNLQLKDFEHNPNDRITALVKNALDYLETRTEFWRQQKPIYARRKDHSKAIVKEIMARNQAFITEMAHNHRVKVTEQGLSKTDGEISIGEKLESNRFTTEALKYVNASMNVVARSVEHKDYQRALSAAKSLSNRLEDIKNLPNLDVAVSDVTSMIGNIYLEVGSLPKAMEYYRKDLLNCKIKKLGSCTSRAFGNMGRIYVKLRKYEDAMAAFEHKLEILRHSKSDPEVGSVSLEKAWLLHDIGRCLLELGREEEAKIKGEESLSVAELLNDTRWCLNACVLIGQVEVRQKRVELAIRAYTKALTFSQTLGDTHAVRAITEALLELNSEKGSSFQSPTTKGQKHLPHPPRGIIGATSRPRVVAIH